MTEHRIKPAIKLGALLGVLWEIFFIGFMLNMPDKRYLSINLSSDRSYVDTVIATPFSNHTTYNLLLTPREVYPTWQIIPLSERMLWAAGLATFLFGVMLILIYFYPHIRQFSEDLLRKE